MRTVGYFDARQRSVETSADQLDLVVGNSLVDTFQIIVQLVS